MLAVLRLLQTKLKNQYRELRRKSDDGHELATYVEQFGVPGEERGRRRSVTLGAAIMAGRVAKRIKVRSLAAAAGWASSRA